mmetsp:Transcript_30668/g.74066  ORF Transcript_30668/g.74066 Transcript_30668/m.74066 type:complete len:722 (-) Transcript_30668:211-2376(-)|eukprot:CAMPEP_0181107822 /NCGR_PEP_ID=MMETSP1071-20121207/17292_1 /TAXON_ID=35127 /ORGANISM="Thalassiosira sp., Strain NH16" /LENGTH=721 /DNA_ID=CAMNT_0023191365 /DNA_START=65 /DNA_END=2230 /DNA_ORIENTATION=-
MILRSIAVVATAVVSSASISSVDAKKNTTETTPPTPAPTVNEPDPDDAGITFQHFKAFSSSQTCASDEHALPFNNQIRGVNLGGWLVLEPWITPSLFYQFLGGGVGTTGMDHYSFCEVLGAEEGNEQLRRHWETWVTEDIIKDLAGSGAVNSLRVPVGDFMFEPYGPYVGCTDGAIDYLDRLLDWARSYGLSVLLDVHTQRDSQNGFDNSGQTLGFQWTSSLSTYPRDLTTFQHWPIRSANWIGEFDNQAVNYTTINYENINHSLGVIEKLVDRYHDHPAVLGVEPVNEPWELTPLKELKKFYWDAYLIVKKKAHYWKFIMHDSFRFTPETWGGFMKGCPDRALDTHIYQAWNDPASRLTFYNNACAQKKQIALMEREFGPVVVGEWSLATDNCAMWLNGFNDNLPGFPRSPCKYIPCSAPYMGDDQPGTPVDIGKPLQGPYGTGMSGPSFGLCPVDRDWMTERYNKGETGMSWVSAPPEAPRGRDGTDEVMTLLAHKKISAFSGIGHGFYFWNFRTDLYNPQWSYMLALERGWIPKGNLNDERIINSCDREDTGAFVCQANRDAPEKSIRGGVGYALGEEGKSAEYIDSLHDDDLYDEADLIFSEFWDARRGQGATCDFGGAAILAEQNKTHSEDYYTDDYFNVMEVQVFPVWKIVLFSVLGALVGGLAGFAIAMKLSPKFNRKVRSSMMLRPVTSSRAFRQSFGNFIEPGFVGLQIDDE